MSEFVCSHVICLLFSSSYGNNAFWAQGLNMDNIATNCDRMQNFVMVSESKFSWVQHYLYYVCIVHVVESGSRMLQRTARN